MRTTLQIILLLVLGTLNLLGQSTVTDVTSTSGNGYYKAGDVVSISVVFSEDVNVTGTPRLWLQVGMNSRFASYLSGSGSGTLIFRYIVKPNDFSADLDYTSTSALDLNGGTIRNTALVNANLTLPTPGAANSLSGNKNIYVDAVKPTVSNVTSSNGNGTYSSGTIAINITFSEAVAVTGSPQLLLETGTIDRYATYSSGTGTSTLTFNYVITSGDLTSKLDYKKTSSLELNDGTILDLAGNPAVRTLPQPGATGSLGANKNIAIDAEAPTIISVSSLNSNGSYKQGENIDITINFSENVNVTGTPILTLETGTIDRDASYLSGTGSSTLVFRYTVDSGDMANPLDYTATSSLDLDGGTISDAATNNAVLGLPEPGTPRSLSGTRSIVIDTQASTVSTVSSPNNNGTYILGNIIDITVEFNEAVWVTGIPRILLETGTVDRYATYRTGSGSNTLSFRYKVQSGDISARLDYVANNSLEFNEGTIKDKAGNTATLTLAEPAEANSLFANKNIVVDGVIPTVSSVTSTIDDDIYNSPNTITIDVVFSEAVNVVGVPRLLLETGDTDRFADYSSGTGSNTLRFSYAVQPGDENPDLDYKTANSLYLNGGTIKDLNGNNASLTLPVPGAVNSLGHNKNIIIDAVAPEVVNVTSTNNNGSYKAGSVIDITIEFSEAVDVTGVPKLTLETGLTDRTANYHSGDGTSTLLFKYTVQAGDEASKLDYLNTSALALDGGTILDAADNVAVLTLATPGERGSLGKNKNIVIDTEVPTVLSVSASTPDDLYGLNQNIDIIVEFSESVLITGSPRIKLDVGKYAVYRSGNSTDSISFRYRVQAGDEFDPLEYFDINSLELNLGTILDRAGNEAELELPALGGGNSLADNANIVIDGVVPYITNVTATNDNGPYTSGQTIDVVVTFNENVDVTGTPQLQLETGTVDRLADYISGTGSISLTFRYTIVGGDMSSDLDYKSTNSLRLNNGSIKDAAGNSANRSLFQPGEVGSLGANKDIIINATQPTVINVSSSTANGSYKAGAIINITVTFSEAVTVGDTPQLTLETGTTDQVVDYTSGSGSSTLVFAYTVQTGDASPRLDYVATGSLALNGGSITDAAGNNAILTLPEPGENGSLGKNKNIIINTSTPTVVSVSSTNDNGTYIVNDLIDVTVLFSEAVVVTGSPRLLLETGAVDRYATYRTGSGSNTLSFRYRVQSGDTNGDLDYVATNSLELNEGTIADRAGNAATLTLVAPGAVGSLGDSKSLVVDGVIPTVTNVASAKANGSYKAGEEIVIEVTFSENVDVTGTPRLLLETGTIDRYATYFDGTGSSTLEFTYTVQAGDATPKLDYKRTTSLELNGGTIKDANGNVANRALPQPGAANSLGANKNLIIDAIAPTVVGVSSTTANGSYKAGATINVTVTFSEIVNVSGTPQLTLENGTSDRVVDYTSGSGTSTLVFAYIVQAGDTSPDLDYVGTGSLDLNGGTIRDGALNDATLTLTDPGTAGSLGHSKNIVIDTSAPTVALVSSTTDNGTYILNDLIDVTVQFSEVVVVTGSPRLLLETGAVDRYATYRTGSGTNTISFRYKVQSGDTNGDLDYVATNSLELNEGTIADRAGNAATLTLVAPGAVGSLGDSKSLVVDGVIPTVTNVASAKANGSYKAGEEIVIEVTFSENVDVTGTPRLLLETGTIDRYATYFDGTGSSTLEFTYTVQPGDATPDLDYKRTTSLELNGGTIKDANGNVAIRTLPQPGQVNSLGANKNLIIDAIAPTVVSVSSTTANGSYKAGATINVTVTFSEDVNVTGTPQLTLETGTTDQVVDYTSGSGTSTLVFAYIVQAGDTSLDLDYVGTGSLALNGGTIRDGALNDATLTLATPGTAGSLGHSKNIVIDTSAPIVELVSSTAGNGTYILNDLIDVTVRFSETVVVTGSPRLLLETGAVDRYATYRTGSGTNTLSFRYKVQSGDNSTDLDYVATNSLELNEGTITDRAGNAATLTLAAPAAEGSLGHSKNLVVDGVIPTVTNVTSAKANGSYKAGEVIVITVTFTEAVNVVEDGGTPTLQLETGTVDQYADYTGGSGTATLEFTYTVQAGDATPDLDYKRSTALSLNGGTIKDLSGNNANLGLPLPGASGSLGDNKNIVIDTEAPTVTIVSSTTENGIYKAGDLISVTVTFSETVTVTNTPRLTLQNGTSNRVVDYSSGSGSSTLVFNYIVQAGDNSVDLDYVATTSLVFNDGTIVDAAGNSANLTLSTPGTAGSLGHSKNIVVDTQSPTITNVIATTPDGTYGEGEKIYIKVIFSEVVNVVTTLGTPSLALNTGGTATYFSGTGTDQIIFEYIVLSGHSTGDLDYDSNSALALNSGSIMDAAGNNADLTLEEPGDPGSLGDNSAIVINTSKSSGYMPLSDKNPILESTTVVSLYPNPSKGLININVDGSSISIGSVVVFDSFGRLVYSDSNVSSSIFELNLNLAPGIYFLKIKVDGIEHTKRFVIQ